MSRKLAVRWRSARFGLNLIQLACQFVAYLYLANAIVQVGITPFMLAREFSGFLGFSVASILGALYFGVLRGAWHAQFEYFRWLVVFIVGTVLVYFVARNAPAQLDRVITLIHTATPYALYGAAGAGLLGGFYCLTTWGGTIGWLSAIVAFVALIGASLFMLVANQVPWATPWIPTRLSGSWLSSSPGPAAVALACVAVYFHCVYLKHLAARVQDSATGDYADSFRRFHLIGSAIILVAVIWGSRHTVTPVVTVGSVNLDSLTVILDAIKSVMIAIEGVWFSRCVAGARDLIDPYRGHGVTR